MEVDNQLRDDFGRGNGQSFDVVNIVDIGRVEGYEISPVECRLQGNWGKTGCLEELENRQGGVRQTTHEVGRMVSDSHS